MRISLFLILAILPFLNGLAQQPSILGSMPKNGSKDLMRNAIISVGLQFSTAENGIDQRTLNQKTVHLYPKGSPGKMIDAYVMADENAQILIVEPAKLLPANSEIVFEITSGLKDRSGNAFGPYKITFSTNGTNLPKHISTDRPKIVHHKKEKKYNPKPAYKPVFASKQTKVKTATPAAVAQDEKPGKTGVKDNSTDTEKPASQNANSAIETDESPIAEVSANEKKETVTMENPSAEKPTKENTIEEKETVAENNPSTTPEAGTEVAPQKEESVPEKAAPKSSYVKINKVTVAENGKLPVFFFLLTNAKIQYVIKNPKGEIVKKGSGNMEKGEHQKGLSLRDLPPGRYLLLLKVGEIRKRHEFTIK